MAVTQDTYTEIHAIGIHGQIANSVTCDADTKIAEGPLEFGRAVSRGRTDEHVQSGLGLNNYIGVTFKDRTRDPSEGDRYKAGAHAAIAWRGDIFIQVEQAVAYGDKVTAAASDGKLHSGNSSGLHRIVVTNGGSNYNMTPTVAITGGGGSGATATVTISSGAITAVNITAAGTGYTSVPTITISADAAGTGSGATAVAILDRFTIPGASWQTAAGADEIARLRLQGDQSTNA